MKHPSSHARSISLVGCCRSAIIFPPPIGTLSPAVWDAAFDLREQLESANHRGGKARLERLERADEALDKVRTYLRLAHRWQWLSAGQYQHVSLMTVEIGRLLGGWTRITHP
jgi:hypothetical protein